MNEPSALTRQAGAERPTEAHLGPSWVEQLVTVRQVGDLRVFRVAVGGIEVLSYPDRDRAEQVAAGLRAAVAAAHEAECGSQAVPAVVDGSEAGRRRISGSRGRGTASVAILGVLDTGPATSREIARTVHRRRQAVLAELRALEVAGQVVREGRGRAARFRVAEQPDHLPLRDMLGHPI